jgi:formylglycine-generating enzyme required for sulfatase activity
MEFQKRYQFDPGADLIGEGIFSRVYRATDTLSGRPVALKYFTPEVAAKYQVLSRIKKIMELDHHNICIYYDVAVLRTSNILGETEEVIVGIMELLDGGNFRDFVKKHPQYRDKLLVDILHGLSYLHRKGIIYRDLRPENVMIRIEAGEPIAKITDVGITKLSEGDENDPASMIGSIEYMPPEQLNPKRYGKQGTVSTNLDLWSFGLLVYESVTDQKLFGSVGAGTSPGEVISNILHQFPLAQINALPGKYKQIVNQCLVKDAAERVQQAAELVKLFGRDGISPGKLSLPEPISNNSISKKEVHLPGEDLISKKPVDHNGSGDLDLKKSGVAENPPGILLNSVNQKTDPPVFPGPHPVLEENNTIRPADVTPVKPKRERVFVRQPEKSNGNLRKPVEPPVKAPDKRVPSETSTLKPVPETKRPEVFAPTPAPVYREGTPRAVTRFQIEEQKRRRRTRVRNVVLTVLVLLMVSGALYFNYYWKQEPAVAVIEIPEPVPGGEVAFQTPPMITVSGGSFMMGSDLPGTAENARPAHPVKLENFSIGKYEVTVREFSLFISDTRHVTTADSIGFSWVYDGNDWVQGNSVNWTNDVSGKLIGVADMDVPVMHVSWADAMSYCVWLSKKTGEKFRLPTEAEWEFAARGGNNSKGYSYSGSNTLAQVGWFEGNAGKKVSKVGKKSPNELGLFDMSGNVMEWCYDFYSERHYKTVKPGNLYGPASGTEKVARGGSWFTPDVLCRSTYRMAYPATSRGGNIGFRLCKPGS